MVEFIIVHDDLINELYTARVVGKCPASHKIWNVGSMRNGYVVLCREDRGAVNVGDLLAIKTDKDAELLRAARCGAKTLKEAVEMLSSDEVCARDKAIIHEAMDAFEKYW